MSGDLGKAVRSVAAYRVAAVLGIGAMGTAAVITGWSAMALSAFLALVLVGLRVV